MSRFTEFVGFFGVSETQGEARSPLCGPLVGPILRRARSKPYCRASEPSAPQPSWVTTKETAAWRFGA
jgi:hypothetical protein